MTATLEPNSIQVFDDLVSEPLMAALFDVVHQPVYRFGQKSNAHDAFGFWIANVPLELSPLLIDIFRDGETRYGPREFSPNIIRRLEEAVSAQIRAPGFPAEIIDDEPEEPGSEVVVRRGASEQQT